jgi:signal peptidase II
MQKIASQARVSWKYVILGVTLLGIILLDQFTKHWILQVFGLGETVPVIADFFNLTYVRNQGAAFGLFAQSHPFFRVPFFIVVPLVALSSIGYLFYKIRPQENRLAVSLSLIIAGAIGNLMDRLMLGYVVDFLDFHWHWKYHFPAFNVADSAICIGVGLVMLDLLFGQTEWSRSEGKK